MKRWAVLAEHPGIESGELTGNLKIRRQVVLNRRAPVVEMLYTDSAKAEVAGVLHVGASRCA